MRRALTIVITLSLMLAGCSGSDAASSPSDADDVAGSAPANTARSGCGNEDQPSPGTDRMTVTDDRSRPEVDREVERVIPASYDGTTPAPLILSLHGFTSNIDQLDLFSGLPDAAGSRGYVLLTPQGLPATVPIGDTTIKASFWNILPGQSDGIGGLHDDVGFLLDLVDDSISGLCIDPDRVYVTGNSNGAGMAATLACAGNGRFAAIAPVSGINLAEPCDDPAPVSAIAFHGDADPLVGYDGGSDASLGLETPSVIDAAASFASADHCAADPVVSEPFGDIELRRWSDCAAGTAVELYTVRGGGHTWPGMLNYVDATKLSQLGGNQELTRVAGLDMAEVAGHMTVSIEATKLILDFFDEHRRPA